MAVTGGILIQIVLMIFIGLVETLKGEQLDRELFNSKGLLCFMENF